ELLGDLCRLPGCYVPSLYEVSCDAQAGTVLQPRQGAPATVRRLWSGELDRQPTSSVVVTPTSEFGEMQLVEISRGCPRGCRFCAAGFIYLPYRQRSVATVTAELDRALAAGRRIGLVAAAVGDYRGIGEVCQHILAAGGKVSVSSLRIDGVDEGMIEVLKASGHKTVALAPEGGSQRLRDLIRKGISEEQILAACDRLIAADILNLKLYFIIGLPTETDDDLAELVALVSKIRERVVARARSNRRLGEILLSVNPFIPKPFTPFQWRGMLPLSLLEKRVQQLHKQFGRMANVRLQVEGLKDAVLQALLARGSRELAPLVALADERGGWRKAAKAMELDVAGQVTRTIPLQERLPWDFIDSGNRELLVREYQAAFSGQG
ncbi:MAG TPA: radical SAM protein, partial [Geobacteraceae bacterium]